MIDGIRIEGQGLSDGLTVRTLESTPAITGIAHNERDCDIAVPPARTTWENEHGESISGSSIIRNFSDSDRIRSGSSGKICHAFIRVPEGWEGQECSVHIEVQVGGEWQREWTGRFKVENIGLCPL